jgi:hypothetical protein
MQPLPSLNRSTGTLDLERDQYVIPCCHSQNSPVLNPSKPYGTERTPRPVTICTIMQCRYRFRVTAALTWFMYTYPCPTLFGYLFMTITLYHHRVTIPTTLPNKGPNYPHIETIPSIIRPNKSSPKWKQSYRTSGGRLFLPRLQRQSQEPGTALSSWPLAYTIRRDCFQGRNKSSPSRPTLSASWFPVGKA